MTRRSPPRSSRSKWIRRLLWLVGVLVVVAIIAVLGLRRGSLAELRQARAAFAEQVGPLHPERLDLVAEGERSDGLEGFRQARDLHQQGRRALAEGRLDEAVGIVEAIVALRARSLEEDPRLLDLLVAHATSRHGLELTAALLETPNLPPALLRRIQVAYDREADHLGVDAALIHECEYFLAQMNQLGNDGAWNDEAGEGKLSARIYYWARGPADTAATIRLYHGMTEAMRAPVLDVGTYLRQRSQPKAPSFRVVSDFLIPNLQDGVLTHRYETTSRRLVRLATSALLTRQRTGAFPTLEDLPADDLGDAVTGGRASWNEDPDGTGTLFFPDAESHRATRPTRPDTAPPAFPLTIQLPPATPEPRP